METEKTKPSNLKRYGGREKPERMGAMMANVLDKAARGKFRLPKSNVLEMFTRYPELIPKSLDRTGIYLILPGAQAKAKNGNMTYQALHKSGKGWQKTVVYDNDLFSST